MNDSVPQRRWGRWIARSLFALTLLAGCAATFAYFQPLPGETLTPSGARRHQCVYVPLRDGIRVAVNFLVPPDLAAGQRLPTLFQPARYSGATEAGFLTRVGSGLGFPTGPAEKEAENYTRAGYVLLAASLRGSGASFGHRPPELSESDVDDRCYLGYFV